MKLLLRSRAVGNMNEQQNAAIPLGSEGQVLVESNKTFHILCLNNSESSMNYY